MLALTVLVLGGMMRILTTLHGDTNVTIDTSKVLEALNLTDAFELSFSDIPLYASTAAPTETPQEQYGILPEPTAYVTLAPTPQPTSTPFAGGNATLTIGGSVCVETGVRQSGYYSDSQKYDLDEVLNLLQGEMMGDLCMVSMENLVVADSKVSDLIAPDAALQMLRSAGVDVVNLGFAKALDKGVASLQETVNSAKAKGLRVIGAYAQEAESAISSQIVEINGIKIALLHYTDNLSNTAKKKLNGQAWVVPTTDTAVEGITKARQMGAQVVLVSLHWGKSGSSSVTKAQQTLAQQLADAGADVIVGVGSRIVQQAAWLSRPDGGQTLCCYGLGSLISDSRTDAGVAGMLLQLTIQVDATGKVSFPSTAYTPTYVWRYKQDGSYHYRVVASDGTAPDGMDDSQNNSRERAARNTAKYLGENSPLVVRGQ